jgi:hypothetical protein
VKPGEQRWRVIVRLKQPITDLRHFDAVHAKIRADIGAVSTGQAKDPSRLWYVPGCPRDMLEQHEAFYQRGVPFDPSMVTVEEKPESEQPKQQMLPPTEGAALYAAKVLAGIKVADVPSKRYEPWLYAGMAIHHHTGGSAEGLRVWDEWSRQQPSYVEGDCDKRWSGFGSRKGGEPKTIGYLEQLYAEQNGHCFAEFDEIKYTRRDEAAARAEIAAIEFRASGKGYDYPEEHGGFDLDLKVKPKPRQYIIPGFLPANITAVFAGHGGHGKSLAALYLGVAVALGKPFFGLPAGKPGVVFLALGEDDREEAERRLYGIAEQLQLTEAEIETLRRRLKVYCCVGQDVKLTTKVGGRTVPTGADAVIACRVNAHAEACGLADDAPRLVILDHFMLFSGGELNANEDASAFAEATGRIMVATGATVVTLAHSPKANDDAKLNQHSVLGAVSTVNLARMTLLMQRMIPSETKTYRVPRDERESYLNLWIAKTNYTKRQGVWLKEVPTLHETVVLEPVDIKAHVPSEAELKAEGQAKAKARTSEAEAAIVDFLNEGAQKGSLHSVRELEKAVSYVKKHGKVTRNDIAPAVAHLISRGVLEERDRPGGKGKYLAVLRAIEPFEAVD